MVEQEAKVIHSRSGSSDLGFLWFQMKWREEVISGLNNKDHLIGLAQCEQVLSKSFAIQAIAANYLFYTVFFFFPVKKKFHKNILSDTKIYTDLNTKLNFFYQINLI